MYVATNEIIVEEFSISRHKWTKFVFYLLGVLMISLLWFLEHAAHSHDHHDHDHDHDHDHGHNH